MNKQQTKTQSGITLVALIITIIVLLILAIVSIRTIQQGGIIGKAQNAVNSYEDKRELEENTINEYENLIGQYEPSERKAYVMDGGVMILTANKILGFDVNKNLVMDENIRYSTELENEGYTRGDDGKICSKYIYLDDVVPYMALSQDESELYLLEVDNDQKKITVTGQATYDASIDISAYLN